MKIVPTKLDFYFAKQDEIADRVKYTLENGKWVNYHIAAWVFFPTRLFALLNAGLNRYDKG